MTVLDRVLIFDVDPHHASTMARPLVGLGLTTVQYQLRAEVVEALGRDHPGVALIVEEGAAAGDFEDLVRIVRSQKIATIGVIDPGDDPIALAARVRDLDGWISRDQVARELPARIAEVLGRVERRDRTSKIADLPAIDARFLALVVHDLRTPLNVIGLTIRAISQTSPDLGAEFDEDLTFLQENARQIEKMLSQLADYCRLIEAGSQVSAFEFDPRRFLSDFLEDSQGRQGPGVPAIRLEIAENSPQEVALDPNRARLALQHVLANAVIAAGEAPIRLRSSGLEKRWIIEMVVEKPPPSTVSTIDLSPEKFERLTGSAAERRGLDLAIAARVSELFGGSARLEAELGRRTTVALNWPQRLPTRE